MVDQWKRDASESRRRKKRAGSPSNNLTQCRHHKQTTQSSLFLWCPNGCKQEMSISCFDTEEKWKIWLFSGPSQKDGCHVSTSSHSKKGTMLYYTGDVIRKVLKFFATSFLPLTPYSKSEFSIYVSSPFKKKPVECDSRCSVPHLHPEP